MFLKIRTTNNILEFIKIVVLLYFTNQNSLNLNI